MIKKNVILIILSHMLLSVLAQEYIYPEWESALGGTVTSEPKKTSYGFIMLSEGRILNACTENGSVLWRQNIQGFPSPYYAVTNQNFIYITTDNANKLSLYNPDGIFLWEVSLDKPAIADPLGGRDGRVFVLEENAISAYGTRGIRKWRTEVPKGQGFELLEMNDGSILYVLDYVENSGSFALRISPYGEILEKIEFIDKITIMEQYTDGVIVGFENGAVGSCAVIDGVTKTTASVVNTKNDSVPNTIVVGREGFIVQYSNNTATEYSLDTHKQVWTVQLPTHFYGGSNSISYIEDVYIFSNTEYVCAYSDGNSSDAGIKMWEKYIAQSSGSYFPIVTRSAYLIVAKQNWVIAGYKLLDQKTVFNQGEVIDGNIQLSYESFTSDTKRLQRDYETILEVLQNNDYGTLELSYKNIVKNNIENHNFEYSSFGINVNVTEKAQDYILSSMFQTSDFNYIVPYILSNEVDPYFIQLAFTIAASIAYDPNETMLKSIENYYFSHRTSLTDNMQLALSDAVYQICRYMGRPALLERGKQILTSILQTNKNPTVQAIVGETLYAFIELEN